jgi:hypothetical protein
MNLPADHFGGCLVSKTCDTSASDRVGLEGADCRSAANVRLLDSTAASTRRPRGFEMVGDMIIDVANKVREFFGECIRAIREDRIEAESDHYSGG